jgi:phospholipid/cholesterol/gamma-HCH transport system ATP-binding protein
MEGAGTHGDCILSFNSVSLFFDDFAALLNVSFTLGRGETRVILGEAGSGKSVLLKAAQGLLRPDKGRVCAFGQDITELDEVHLFDVRARIGVLFQEGGLFDSLNIQENVSYPLLNQPRHASKLADLEKRVRESLRFVELEHTLDRFPSELSGGMRRRVGIARANVTGPELLLYDSPTAGLDPITANTIIGLILKARDTTHTACVIATHRIQDGHMLANFRYNPESGELDKAKEADARTTFMVMQEGRLVFEGSERELYACPDPYVMKFAVRH